MKRLRATALVQSTRFSIESTGFNPAQVSGLSCWFDGQSGVQTETAALFTAASAQCLFKTDQASLRYTTAVTACVWFYPVSFAVIRSVFSKFTSFGSFKIDWQIRVQTTGQVECVSADGSSQTGLFGSSNTATLNQWNFAAITINSATREASINLNGTVTTGTFAFTPGQTNSPIEIGANFGGAGSPFDGRIQCAGYFDGVLSTAQIAAIYNSGNGTSYAGIEALGLSSQVIEWWELTENAGSTRIGSRQGISLSTSASAPTSTNGRVSCNARANTPVARWVCRSSGYTPAQTTEASKPIYTANVTNSKFGLVFDGTNHRLTAAIAATLLPNTKNFYVFTVYNPTSTGTYRAFLGVYPTSASNAAYDFATAGGGGSDIAFRAVNNATFSRVTPAPVITGQYNVVTGYREDSLVTVRQAGAAVGSNSSLAGAENIDSTANFNIGSRENSATNLLQGTLCEILIYNRADNMPLAEIQKIERYLGQKYNITVA